MLQQQLVKLKDFILTNNPYLNTGYSEVYQDVETGHIASAKKIVFPADNEGDYFYLRLPNQLAFDYNPAYNVTGSQSGVALAAKITLVACMRKANADKLCENLINTIRNYPQDLKLTGAIYQPEDVVMQELGKVKKEVMIEALKKLPSNMAIVSISFILVDPMGYQPLKCITSPCS